MKINEDLINKLVNSLKILKSACEFLHSQLNYDHFFLKQRINFLMKDKEFLQSNFENLDRIIKEKSKEISEKNEFFERTSLEKAEIIKKLEESHESSRKSFELEIEEIRSFYIKEEEDLRKVLIFL